MHSIERDYINSSWRQNSIDRSVSGLLRMSQQYIMVICLTYGDGIGGWEVGYNGWGGGSVGNVLCSPIGLYVYCRSWVVVMRAEALQRIF